MKRNQIEILKRCKSLFLAFFALFSFASQTLAQTSLSAGDVALIAVNSDGLDGFTFLLLDDISASTEIHFTDRPWDTVTASFGLATEGTVTWKSSTNMSKGATVSIENVSSGTLTASTGTASATGLMNLSSSGDQILVYQGTTASPSFIYAFNTRWSGGGYAGHSVGTSSINTHLPPGLTRYKTAWTVRASSGAGGHMDNWQYNCTKGVTGVKDTILKRLNTMSNWTTSNTTVNYKDPGCTWVVGSTLVARSPKRSATDSVIITGTNASVRDWGRGFEFKPKETISVTDIGGRMFGVDTFPMVLWDVANQKELAKFVFKPTQAGVYEYTNLADPVVLVEGKSYAVIAYGDQTGYYFGSSSQANEFIEYVAMRFCGGCSKTQPFPTSTIGNFHYGTPDFLFLRSSMLVSGNGNVIASGSTVTDTANSSNFDTVYTGTSLEKDYYAFNLVKDFEDTVLVTGSPKVSITGTNASDFAITQQIAADTLFGEDSALFKIKFTPSALGLREATVNIAYTDSLFGAKTYTFKISGVGAKYPLGLSIVLDSNAKCASASDGGATATVTDGKRPFTYAWTGLTTTDSFITNVGKGTYYLTVTDANNFTISDSVKVGGPDALSALSPTSNAQKSVTLTGDYGGWLNSANSIVEGSPTSFVFSGLLTGNNYRAWTRFDVSSIPAGSIVDSITLELGMNGTGNAGTTETVKINNGNSVKGPYGSFNSTAYADFGTGTYGTVDITAIGTYSNIKLGGTATQDLKSQLSSGYFQVAMVIDNPTTWKRFTSNLNKLTVYYKSSPSKEENVCYGNIGDTVDVFDTAYGGSGNYAYFWEMSKDLGSTYAAATGKNDSIHYIPTDKLYDTTYYRRRVIDLTCSDTVYNDPAKYFVADSFFATLTVDSNATTATSTDAGISATAQGGVAPYSYSWSNSVSAASNPGVGIGWHTLTVTDAVGCSFVDSIEVKRRFGITIVLDSNVSCNGLSNGGATASIEGGVKPLTYQWVHGDTTKTIAGMAAGTYTFRVIDAAKDTIMDSITITEPALLLVSAVVDSNVTCFGLTDGGATASATGGTTPYIFDWNTHPTTTSIMGVGAGTYSVIVTDKNGCTDSTGATITQPDSIELNITYTKDISCFGEGDGELGYFISGGTAPYYEFGNVLATQDTITDLNPTHERVYITDNNGCVDSSTMVIINEPALLTVSVTIDSNVTCNGEATGGLTAITSGGTGTITYAWSNSATTASISSVVAGNYEVIVQDANGCKDTADNDVTEPTLLMAGGITGDDVVCAGVAPNKITELSAASGGTGSLSYQWQMSSDNSNWSDISGATTSEYQPTGTAGNTWYRRMATDANSCGPFASDTVQITINGQPTASFTATTACEGQQTLFTDASTVTSGAIASYDWSFGDKGTSSQQNPINIYKNNGSYTVQLVVATDSGCVDSTSTTVSVNAMPSVDFSATAECEGDATVFSNKSSISSGSLSYSWDLGDKNNSTASAPSYTYTNAGFYTVQLTATSGSGCVDSISKTVQVKQVAKPNFSATSVCEGLSTQFTNLSTNAGTYSWDFADGGSGSKQANPKNKYKNSGAYTVVLTATSADGCSDTAQRVVNVYALPVAAFSANEECLGDATDFTNSSSGASGYQWVFGNGTSSNNTNPSVIYATAGNYKVELTATTSNGCTDVTSSTVTVNALPEVSFSAADICLSEDLKTINNTSGANSYAWTFGDGNSSTATAPSHTYTTHGVYEVMLVATSSKGCVSADSADVNVFAVPSVSYTVNDVCFGVSSEFKNSSTIAAGTMTYVWDLGDGSSTGNPSPSYQYAADGNYTVKLVATSNEGCKDSVSNTATVYAMPVVDFSAPSVCYGDTMFTNNLSSGAASFAWSFGDGNSSANVSPFNFYAAAGDYDVQLIATTSNNCVDSMSKNIEIYAKPIAGFDAKDVCDESAVGFNNTSYNANITSHNWDLGDGNTSLVINPDYTYAGDGSYDVTLITVSDNGCSDTVSKTIIVHPNPVVSFTNSTECDYDSTVFTNNTSIASGTSSYEWNFGTGDKTTTESPKYHFPQAGAYVVSLTATSDNGCERSASATIVVHPSPVAGIELANNCEGMISVINSASTISKGDIVNYNWDLGDGTSSSLENPAHLYASDADYDVTLIVTSDQACTDTASTSITIYNKPVASFSTPDMCFGQLSEFTDASLDAQNYTYDFGDRWGISILAEPEYTYEEPGTYDATLYVTSQFGCRDTITKSVTIFDLPVALFTVNNHCFGEDFTPADNSQGTVNDWNWDYDNGDSDNGIDPIYTYGKDGDYNVRLIVTDNNGCVDSLRKRVTVWPLPDVWIRTDTLVSKGYTVPMEARGGVEYKWSPVDNLDRPLIAKPTATVIEDITYTVTVANEFGCTKDTSATLRVEDDYTLEPSNIMTPDGNGKNDNWIVEKAQYYNDVEVIVFDRWGRIVYQNTNYDNTWNGISQATGDELPDGAYYYIVKVPADREEYKGSITIFR